MLDFEDTHKLFLESHALQFMDLFKSKTAQTMYKAINNLLPDNIQNMLMDREGAYNIGGKLNLKQRCVCTTLKSMCIVYGILKDCFFFSMFGIKYFNSILNSTHLNVITVDHFQS